MQPKTHFFLNCSCVLLAAAAILAAARPASGQVIAYDDAGNYIVSANWTNGADQGFGFIPWVIMTNGPDSHGTYVVSGNNPVFVIASVTNLLGTNYNDVWGTYANGANGVNETTAYRGFANPLSTNTFKIQWGSRGAGVTTLNGGSGQVHGWCGFTLRNGNVTNSTADFQTQAMLYFFFQDGLSPSTLYYYDAGGYESIPNTSFSDLGRQNITNAVQVEVTPGADGSSFHLVVKDCVQGRTLFTTNSTFLMSGTVDSAALFCHETTGDQVYNRMQITSPTNVAPSFVNVQPADGSLYLDPNATSFAFEVDSFNSTVASSQVTVYLDGVAQSGITFNTTDPTNQLIGSLTPALASDQLYSYVIIAQDANGNRATNAFTFNTFLPTDLYIDAYDYNYNIGQFINSSTPANSYANLLGTNGIDYNISDLTGVNNTAGYRPGDLVQTISLATDSTGDPIDHANLRANGHTAFNVGFTDIGNWENYTRVIPTPTNYSIYARAASGAGGQFEIEELVNPTATSSNQPLVALGRVSVPNTGGSLVYRGELMPLTDAFGNTVVVPLSGTKTFRQTAISSRGYNLEYLLVVAVTNFTSTLRPYLSVASPAPGSTGVSLATPITFSIANRQTTVNTGTIKLYTNSVAVSTGLVLSNNAAGSTGTYTPTANFAPNATNTVAVVFTDSGGITVSNSWSFVTAGTGGLPGNGVWSGGGGFDLNWSTAANWTGGTPGPGFSATFATPGATTTLVTNNIVSTNITISQLNYSTNNNGYHTTYIPDGVTLTVSNNTTGVSAALQVGFDTTFNKPVTNTITGANGTLLLLGNPQGSGQANQLNIQVRQSASPPAPEQTVLDLSGLGTLVATVGKFTVAQGGTGTGQGDVSGRVNLARTNVITLLRANSGQFEVGDSSGAATTLVGSTLNLGITNAFFVDTARFGKQKATNNLVRFNPAFAANSPVAYFRGTNGPSSRVTTWVIGDADTDTVVPVNSQALMDFSSGKLDALVSTLILGRNSTSGSDTGSAQGTLTTAAGTLDVSNLQLGVQRAASTAPASGTVNVTGSAILSSTNIQLAQAFAGADPSLVSGTLNVTGGGSVRGNIAAGGGVSTVAVNGGSLSVSNAAGSATAPLSAVTLTGASLHLNVDGNATAAIIAATNVTASSSTITVDSVKNVAGPTVVHLISYSGTDPYAGLTLAPLPVGYSGHLVNNAGSVDLSVNVAAVPPPPSIRSIIISGGQVVIGGTNNDGAGGTFRVLTSTNVAQALTNWSLLTNGSFDANGNFSTTNPVVGSPRFYRLQVP
ncbi:MAG TPA: hypothetical protein VMU04_14015 [Candidatus Acidoferrum sp.]|nr:hypothetical protein [Candidatus Acidoferrum sp.]